jgi:hypothetical protein
MIRYSPRSARAISLLKAFYNDIAIFVEDKASPNMHLLICRRVLGEGVRLSSVNPLGGRDAVVGACRLDQTVSPRKRLYVIDGDLDLLMGRAKPKLKHLYIGLELIVWKISCFASPPSKAYAFSPPHSFSRCK